MFISNLTPRNTPSKPREAGHLELKQILARVPSFVIPGTEALHVDTRGLDIPKVLLRNHDGLPGVL